MQICPVLINRSGELSRRLGGSVTLTRENIFMSSEYLTLTTAVVPVGEWSTERKKKNLKYFDKKKTSGSKPEPFQGLAPGPTQRGYYNYVKPPHPLVGMRCLKIDLRTPHVPDGMVSTAQVLTSTASHTWHTLTPLRGLNPFDPKSVRPRRPLLTRVPLFLLASEFSKPYLPQVIGGTHMLSNTTILPPKPINDVIVRHIPHIPFECILAIPESLTAPEPTQDVQRLLGTSLSSHGVVVLRFVLDRLPTSYLGPHLPTRDGTLKKGIAE